MHVYATSSLNSAYDPPCFVYVWARFVVFVCQNAGFQRILDATPFSICLRVAPTWDWAYLEQYALDSVCIFVAISCCATSWPSCVVFKHTREMQVRSQCLIRLAVIIIERERERFCRRGHKITQCR